MGPGRRFQTGGGALAGLRVVEIASLGPGPFAAMMLADHGADIIRLERTANAPPLSSGSWNLTNRGRPSVGVDLKHPEAVELTLTLCERADVLIEGFRPGVTERLGLGPDAVTARNPRLVYGRITGYGQTGPWSQVAGHDINYLSIAGVLGATRRSGERPMFPLNLLADYGGGGMLLAFGVLAAVFNARRTGRGQVVDASMVDGVGLLATLTRGMLEAGMWTEEPGTNLLDSGAHWYEVYETSDAKFVSVGALESQFYLRLLDLLGLDPADNPQHDRSRWPELKDRFAAIFRTRTRDDWVELLGDEETCVTPVLGLREAAEHPQNVWRGWMVDHAGVSQPAPAPRLSRTPAKLGLPPREPGADTSHALEAWGVEAERIEALRLAGAIG